MKNILFPLVIWTAVAVVFVTYLVSLPATVAPPPPITDVGNGVADATASIQAALDVGATIPTGSYRLTGPVEANVLGMRGAVRNRTVLSTTANDDKGAVRFKDQSWGASVSDFHLSGTGSGTGIRVCDLSVPPVGNQMSGLGWNRVRVEQFGTGVWVGDFPSGRAADSLTFTGVETYRCRTAVKLEAWNTLQILFNNLAMSTGDVGLDTGQAGAVSVVGGGGSGVGVLYKIGAGANHHVSGARAEFCRRFVSAGFGEATVSVTLTECHTAGRRFIPEYLGVDDDGIDVDVAAGTNLTVVGGVYDGCFRYTGWESDTRTGLGSVTLIGVRCKAPVLFLCKKGTRVGFNFINCALVDDDWRVIKRITMSGTVWN
jgi:hypothetical protein